MTERIDDGAEDTSGSYIANPIAPKDGKVIEEGPGVVTSDSLAAESLKSGGSFADGKAVPGPVPSKSTTANTTNTSGATVLAPAPDAASRDVGLEDYSVRPGTTGDDGAYDTAKGGPQQSFAGAAPSYVATVTGDAVTEGRMQPKGTNITEGGFDPDAPNASFNTDVDSSKDPGRIGVLDALKNNAKEGIDAGYPNASVGADAGVGQGGFENLEERQA